MYIFICFSAQAAALNGGNKGPSNTNKTASPEAVLQAALLRIQNLERKYSVLQDKVSLKLHATFFSLFLFLLPFLPFHSFCSIFPPAYIFSFLLLLLPLLLVSSLSSSSSSVSFLSSSSFSSPLPSSYFLSFFYFFFFFIFLHFERLISK